MHGQALRTSRRMRRRPWLASVGLAATILFAGLGSTTAAYADPVTPAAGTTPGAGVPPAPPDTGSVPRPGGSVTPPSTGGTPTTGAPATGASVGGPIGDQIGAQTAQVQRLAEDKKQAKQQLDSDRQNVAAAKRNLDLANRLLGEFGDRTGKDASKAYKSAAKIPDHLDPAAKEYRALAKLAPWLAEPGTVDGRQNGASYQDAKELAAAAESAYKRALQQQSDDRKRYSTLGRQLDRAISDLDTLRARNATALQQDERQQRQWLQQYDGQIGSDVAGWRANPKAVAAVRFALGQLGKPYVWAAEGPDSYDCSGLVLASYQSVGVGLPRIADQQYRATAGRPVALSQLLPGDLIFYGDTPGQSTSIYHVAMYIGQGKIVQAPTFGVPVQVVSLSLGGFYGATRVLPAVRTSKPKPHPSPSPSPSGSKTAKPGPSGSTAPKPSPSHSTSPTPKPSGSGSGNNGGTPAPSASASAPASQTSASASASASPSTSTTSASAPASSSTSTTASPSSTTSASAPATDSTSPAGSTRAPAPAPGGTCASPSPSASVTPSPLPTPTPSASPSPSPTPSCH